MDESKRLLLRSVAHCIRSDVIEMTYMAGRNGAHIGGGLSMCEILATLYFAVMNIDSRRPLSENRDRFILSKGHGALALYSVLKQAGFLTQEDLNGFKRDGTDFWTHPRFMPEKGIEYASGSLGMGLSLGGGTALALKHKGLSARVYVYVGDGECDEGAIWEAASFISHHKLDNVTVIVDENKLQLDAPTKNIINKDNLGERWGSFGFHVVNADGHDVCDLMKAFAYRSSDRPVAIIARTVKGKGVSFAENNPIFHMNTLNEEQYKIAKKEQEMQ